MAIPDFQTLMLPVLRSSALGEVKISDVVQSLADEFQLTDDERSELLPSGKQTTFANRIHWAKSYLGKAGLIELTKRAHFKISARGRDMLVNPPTRIDIHFLEQFPEFVRFRETSNGSNNTPKASPVAEAVQASDMTPDEIIRRAQSELDDELSLDLLTRVIAAPPEFFERLVVQLLLAMGYGGSASEAGRALGKSGDGGVDGVIDQDALGLDRIYVQAKRFSDGNNVGSGAIRDFFGSLDRFKATKGLFVTTSSFSPSARETADFLSKRIVLIDGRQLAKLMIRYSVGCRVEETIQLKKVDEEYFE
ncbi:restriction endonuclease [Paraburkholderia bannensis]|uniref:restriction endonuclease n=1 Tax=Paraburkholderia bannensis TaxID=765414 RepID=UPI002AB7DD6E|nr:restriction endonuclease [Paraburkholderia bannensis]